MVQARKYPTLAPRLPQRDIAALPWRPNARLRSCLRHKYAARQNPNHQRTPANGATLARIHSQSRPRWRLALGCNRAPHAPTLLARPEPLQSVIRF